MKLRPNKTAIGDFLWILGNFLEEHIFQATIYSTLDLTDRNFTSRGIFTLPVEKFPSAFNVFKMIVAHGFTVC